MRAVIDTNVLVSGFLSKTNYPAKVVDAWIFQQFVPIVSPPVIQEYASVLLRKKFSRLGSPEERLEILKMLLDKPQVAVVYPEENLEIVKEDKKDNIFLECALAGKVQYIVSGDFHLLNVKSYREISIVSAQDFVGILSSS